MSEPWPWWAKAWAAGWIAVFGAFAWNIALALGELFAYPIWGHVHLLSKYEAGWPLILALVLLLPWIIAKIIVDAALPVVIVWHILAFVTRMLWRGCVWVWRTSYFNPGEI